MTKSMLYIKVMWRKYLVLKKLFIVLKYLTEEKKKIGFHLNKISFSLLIMLRVEIFLN